MRAMLETSLPAVAESDAGCIACGGARTAWLDMPIDPMRAVAMEHGRAQWCERCGVGSIVPMPAAAQIAGFYRIPSYYTHGGTATEPVPDLFDRVVRKLAWWRDAGRQLDPARLARDLPAGARICDLGCGQGEHLAAFKALGFDVVGVDPDPAARAAAAALGVTVLAGTADAAPAELPRAGFDLVIMTHSLEHCRDPARALATCAWLLKPGGILYCEVPNCACRHFRALTVCSTMFDAPRHLHFFEPRALRQMLVTAGLMPGAELYSGYARQHSRAWRERELQIAGQLMRHSPQRRPVLHTRRFTLGLLARTAFAGRAAKYDSVGIFARRA